MQALADALVARGHEVHVVTLAPHYPQNQLFSGFGADFIDRRTEGNLCVTRLRPALAPRTNVRRRSLAELFNGGMQLLTAIGTPSDVVVASVPSMALSLVGVIAAGLHGARFVLDVRDLYWLYARDLGRVPAGVANSAEMVLSWAMREADVVTCTTPEQASYLAAREPAARRVMVAANGVDDEFFASVSPSSAGTDRSGGQLRVTYAGLVGYAQGLGVLVEAARELPPDHWEVIIAGDGPERAQLQQRASQLGLHHVRFLGYITADALIELYRSSDVLYTQLRSLPAMATAMPTKVLDYLAAGRPVVFGGNGPGARVLSHSGAGIVINPDEPSLVLAALRRLEDPILRATMGVAGRAFVAEGLLRSQVVQDLADVVECGRVTM